MIITANQAFGEWGKVFQDPAMTLAAGDRLVHHSTIFELNNVESHRSKEAARRQKIDRTSLQGNGQRQSSSYRTRCLTLSTNVRLNGWCA